MMMTMMMKNHDMEKHMKTNEYSCEPCLTVCVLCYSNNNTTQKESPFSYRRLENFTILLCCCIKQAGRQCRENVSGMKKVGEYYIFCCDVGMRKKVGRAGGIVGGMGGG